MVTSYNAETVPSEFPPPPQPRPAPPPVNHLATLRDCAVVLVLFAVLAPIYLAYARSHS